MVNPPIHIIVERGHVTLTGVVSDNVERMLARSLASSSGAFSVRDELKTDAEMKGVVEKPDCADGREEALAGGVQSGSVFSSLTSSRTGMPAKPVPGRLSGGQHPTVTTRVIT